MPEALRQSFDAEAGIQRHSARPRSRRVRVKYYVNTCPSGRRRQGGGEADLQPEGGLRQQRQTRVGRWPRSARSRRQTLIRTSPGELGWAGTKRITQGDTQKCLR
ncbi:hypothetical protein BJ970_006801 [Saccharopolyspora phatthalungensis]|uniref:Uncharacterized protein n=1 Tax=Saccharopolyspora phatthalungensis TaxID=664693 RepID=A0A840Q9I4_9PSEU|nr:hypothetical protein [Saccharopolyspora phatthalungensis]